MNLYGLTDIGLVRRNNQDSYAIRVLDENLAIAVVCDGMGGAQAGNVASAVAVETFAAALEDLCRQDLPMQSGPAQDLLRAACRAANSHVYELARNNPEYYGMGTTLVAMLVHRHRAYVVNVGDSRCYLFSEGRLNQITTDHSLVQALVDCGDITPEEARTHPKKNVITRALGTEDSVRSDLFCTDCREGDILLLCSDGLTNTVPDDVLEAELSQLTSPEETARRLLALAVEQGAPDNVTVILAQL